MRGAVAHGGSPVYILTVDQSTSATKAVLTDRTGTILQRFSLGHRQIYPQDGWVEHDPIELYNNVRSVIGGVMREAGIGHENVAAVTITNQRETAVIWDRETGLPIYNAIVWQCRRTAEACDKLKAAGWEPTIHAKTGLLLDAYFSATKWKWLLEHAGNELPAERLLAGTIDSWLIWKLSGGSVHATDYTNASRTLLFNIHTLEWDDELLTLFGIPRHMLPQVYPSDQVVATIDVPELFPVQMPIAGIIGDSQGALFGQQCIRPGMAKATYGTGTSILMNVGQSPAKAENGLVAAIAWGMGGSVMYAVEAIIHSTGDCLNWVRDQLGLYRTYEELMEAAGSVTDSGGVYMVPAFVGLGAPYWRPYARAAIIGLNRSSTRAHLLRAAVDSIAYQVNEAVELLQREMGMKVDELFVDGGATGNELLMQLQADLLGTTVVRAAAADLSALGSAYLGGLAVGFWSSPDVFPSLVQRDRTFVPAVSDMARRQMRQGWSAAVKAVIAADDERRRMG